MKIYKQIRKWGNQSLGVSINKAYAMEEGIEDGDWVEVTVKKIISTKFPGVKK